MCFPTPLFPQDVDDAIHCHAAVANLGLGVEGEFHQGGLGRSYSDQVKPTGAMDADPDTVLGVTPEAIAAELAAQTVGGTKPPEPIMLQPVDRMPPGNITWAASGMVGVR